MPARPVVRSVGALASVGVTDEDIYGDPTDFDDVLDEDEEIVRALNAAEWDKYRRNFHHFIETVLEGWQNEGRRFPSEKAKKKAIADLVNGTREKAKKNPKKWIKEHCDWKPR